MTESFSIVQRYEQDAHLGAPKRHLTASRIADIVAGRCTCDIVSARAPIVEGAVLQLIAKDTNDCRALVVARNLRKFDTYEIAKVASGTGYGTWSLEGDGQCSPNDVMTYMFDSPKYAHALPPLIPPAEKGLRLYDVIHFKGSEGNTGVVSVHATDLEHLRKLGLNASPSDKAAIQHTMMHASTILVINVVSPNGELLHDKSYSFNSRPLFFHVPVDELAENPETLISESGIKVPWRDTPIIASAGREAIRCLLYRTFNYLVVMYERQIVVVPITVNASSNDGAPVTSIVADIVICSLDITAKILEAATHLLLNNDDAALVGIYSPHTACVTTNMTSGWFVVETNVPKDRVEAAYAKTRMQNLVLKSRSELCDYLRQSWRNFAHIRFQDGTQIVLYNPRMRYAMRVAVLPLQLRPVRVGQVEYMRGIELSRCEEFGANYLTRSMLEVAGDAIRDCTQHATLHELKSDFGVVRQTSYMQGTKPLFFDHEGQLRFAKLFDLLKTNIHELSTERGTILQIDSDFLNALDGVEPMLIRHKNEGGGVQSLILRGGKTGADIYEGYMERFVRALITTIYVCYGHQCNMDNNQSLVHMIYRAGMSVIERRARVFALLTTGFEWLMTDIPNFSPEFRDVWTNAKNHAFSAGPGTASMYHKNLLIGYVMNRPNDQFMVLENYLTRAITRWIASKSIHDVKEAAAAQPTLHPQARAPQHVSPQAPPQTRAPPPSYQTAKASMQEQRTVPQTKLEEVSKIPKISIQQTYLDAITSGKKTVEGRINNGIFKALAAGQEVEWYCGVSTIRTTILSIVEYKSFRAMLEGEGVNKCLPGVPTVDAGVALYHSFPNYEARAKEFGVRAIRIQREGVRGTQQAAPAAQLTSTPAQQDAPRLATAPLPRLVPAPAQRPVPTPTRVTALELQKLSPEEQKNRLGESMYEIVLNMYPEKAPIITGMLLEMDNNEILALLDDMSKMNAKILECLNVLKQYGSA